MDSSRASLTFVSKSPRHRKDSNTRSNAIATHQKKKRPSPLPPVHNRRTSPGRNADEKNRDSSTPQHASTNHTNLDSLPIVAPNSHHDNALNNRHSYPSMVQKSPNTKTKRQQLQEIKNELRDQKERLLDVANSSSTTTSDSITGVHSSPMTHASFEPHLSEDSFSTINLAPFVKHTENIERFLGEHVGIDASMDDHSVQMQSLVRKMKRSIHHMTDVRSSFLNAVDLTKENTDMRARIAALEKDIRRTREEREQALLSNTAISTSMREKEQAMLGALKRENANISKLHSKIEQTELAVKKQQEIMQLVLKIAQYKSMPMDYVAGLHERLCKTFDSLRHSGKSDGRLLHNLNQTHREFLIDAIRHHSLDSMEDSELIEVILRNTMNSAEASAWLEEKLKEQKLEIQVKSFLDKAKANEAKLSNLKQLQKLPSFLEAEDESAQTAHSKQNHDIKPAKTPSPPSSSPPPIPSPVPSPKKKKRRPIMSPKKKQKPDLKQYALQSHTAGIHKKNSVVRRRASLPSQTFRDLIQHRETSISKRRRNSFGELAVTAFQLQKHQQKLTSEASDHEHVNVHSLLTEKGLYSHLSAPELSERQDVMLLEVQQFSKSLHNEEEDAKKDQEQEHDIKDKARTLSMYYKVKERAARNQKELEQQQLTLVRSLEALEKKRLQHMMRMQGRKTFSIEDEDRCIVFMKVAHGEEMYETDSLVTAKALELLHRQVKALCNVHIGEIFQNTKFLTGVAFRDLQKGISFALELQLRLHDAHWSKKLLKLPGAKTITDKNGNAILNGLRIQIGVNVGSPLASINKYGRLQYLGSCVDRTVQITDQANGGEIVMASSVYQHVRKWDTEQGFSTPVEIRLKGIAMLGNQALTIPETLRTLMPIALSMRTVYYDSLSAFPSNSARVTDLYPMIEALILSTSNAKGPEDRKEALDVIRHVHMECIKVLQRYSPSPHYLEILEKQLKLKHLLGEGHSHRRNLEVLRNRVTALNQEMQVNVSSMMKAMSTVSTLVTKQEARIREQDVIIAEERNKLREAIIESSDDDEQYTTDRNANRIGKRQSSNSLSRIKNASTGRIHTGVQTAAVLGGCRSSLFKGEMSTTSLDSEILHRNTVEKAFSSQHKNSPAATAVSVSANLSYSSLTDARRDSLSDLSDQGSWEESAPFESILLKRVTLRNFSSQTNLKIEKEKEKSPVLTIQKPDTHSSDPTSLQPVDEKREAEMHPYELVLESPQDERTQSIEEHVKSENEDEKHKGSIRNKRNPYVPVKQDSFVYSGLSNRLSAHDKLFLPSPLVVLSEYYTNDGVLDLQQRWRKLLRSSNESDLADVKRIRRRARAIDAQRQQGREKWISRDEHDGVASRKKSLHRTPVHDNGDANYVALSSTVPLSPTRKLRPIDTGGEASREVDDSPPVISYSLADIAPGARISMLGSLDERNNRDQAELKHQYDIDHRTNSTNFPSQPELAQGQYPLPPVAELPNLHANRFSRMNPLFSRLRSEYLKKVKQYIDDLREKYQGLVERERTIMQNEKQLRNFFKKFCKLSREYTKSNGELSQDRIDLFPPLETDSESKKRRRRRRKAAKASFMAAGVNNNSTQQQQTTQSSSKQRRKPSLQDFWSKLVRFSKQLSETGSLKQESDPLFVNGNDWMDILDPGIIFELATPYFVRKEQIFGPSSLNSPLR